MLIRKKRYLIWSAGILAFLMLLGSFLYGNFFGIYGKYQVKAITYVTPLSSFSLAGYEDLYLGADITVRSDVLKIDDNQGESKVIKRPAYVEVLMVENEEIQKEYKEFFWGTWDEFIETIEISYVIENDEDKPQYMIWKTSTKLYLVEYIVGGKKDYINWVMELGN